MRIMKKNVNSLLRKSSSIIIVFIVLFMGLNGCSEKPLPYLDTNFSFEERAEDLVSRMTLEEKVSQMLDKAPAIERLNVPQYNWWNECLHGVGRAGIATVFPQAIGMAAMWDDEAMFRIADVISDEACKRLGPFAEKHGMYAVFHNHAQFGDPTFNVDTLLAYSPVIMLNWDVGHYFGTTCNEPSRLSSRDFLTKYHNRILSIHLKDSTCPLTTHQVWGQSQTPLAETLLLVKEHKWPIYCDIEMIYPIPEWSNPVKEVRNCVNYCRAVLI